MGSGPQEAREGLAWTERDEVLWQTCAYVAATVAGRQIAPREPMATTFAPQGGAQDVLLCTGPYERLAFRAVGDGSYTSSGGLFLGTGKIGLTLTAGVLVARGLRNRSRRAAAERATVPRWVVEERGQLTVGTRGFHLSPATGVFYWDWGSITEMTIDAPGCFTMSGASTRGPVRWTFATPWAELVFALWALDRHPGHPQLVTGDWLPADFLTRVAESGHEPPLRRAAIEIER